MLYVNTSSADVFGGKRLNQEAHSKLCYSDPVTLAKVICNAKRLNTIQLNYGKVSTHGSCETVE